MTKNTESIINRREYVVKCMIGFGLLTEAIGRPSACWMHAMSVKAQNEMKVYLSPVLSSSSHVLLRSESEASMLLCLKASMFARSSATSEAVESMPLILGRLKRWSLCVLLVSRLSVAVCFVYMMNEWPARWGSGLYACARGRCNICSRSIQDYKDTLEHPPTSGWIKWYYKSAHIN
jgi:hypothetical protein